MKPKSTQRLVFALSFGATLALFLMVLLLREPAAPPRALLAAAPVLGASAEPAIVDLAAGTRAIAGAPESPRAAAFDVARWDDALRAIGAESTARRELWLSSKLALMQSGLVKKLLDCEGGAEGVTLALARLESESDPLIQAVLLRYLGLHEEDPRVVAALQTAVQRLLHDATRPVHAELAVDGLLAALGRQGLAPGAIVHCVAGETQDPVILRDLFMGLALHGFDFSVARQLIGDGLASASAQARFGASESLRMFALDGKLAPAEFVATFAPIVRAETDPNNRLLFLETLGAVGGRDAAPALREVAADPAGDPAARRFAAASLALHGDPADALAFCTESLASGEPATRLAAFAALGALPTAEAVAMLETAYFAAKDPAEKALAIQSLCGKNGAAIAPFLDAAASDDPKLRSLASRQFLTQDEAALSEADRERVHAWLEQSSRSDADPEVRANAMLGAYLAKGDGAEALLEERMRDDASPQVRAAAAASLFLAGFARGDAEAMDRIQAGLAADSPAMQDAIARQRAALAVRSPDEMREGLQRQIRQLDLLAATSCGTTGDKDVFGMQKRVVERMLAKLTP